MSASLHELLAADAGTRIPEAVRETLNEMAAACNTAAVTVNLAFTVVQQSTHHREVHASRPSSPDALKVVAANAESAAESFHAQSMVVLTQAATLYAVYASQVAQAVAVRQPIPPPDPVGVKPSDLIAALFLYLPAVRFASAAQARPDVVETQNDEIAAAYEQLTKVISQQLHGKVPAVYDYPAAVAASGYGAVDATDLFAEALHAYAATLTAAIGFLTTVDNSGEG
ncbi:hypothetical protein [Actinoplanes sp. GCM10030250]|uniref:hypothetical protein n=1 Tax=Actinoplanes sp. GCM10030250 TaxID=3273376 RepID=UPI003607CB8A